jgi:hypothetical protein
VAREQDSFTASAGWLCGSFGPLAASEVALGPVNATRTRRRFKAASECSSCHGSSLCRGGWLFTDERYPHGGHAFTNRSDTFASPLRALTPDDVRREPSQIVSPRAGMRGSRRFAPSANSSTTVTTTRNVVANLRAVLGSTTAKRMRLDSLRAQLPRLPDGGAPEYTEVRCRRFRRPLTSASRARRSRASSSGSGSAVKRRRLSIRRRDPAPVRRSSSESDRCSPQAWCSGASTR